MKQRYSKILILFLLVLAGSNAFAQQIKGVVTDSVTHEPLMYISVYYQEKRDMGTITNIDGEYKLETRRNGGTLVFSAVGYISKTVKVGSGNQTINIQLAPDNVVLNEVVVKPKKEKYSRKNNPAVEFMKKVIEHKKAQVLEVNDYFLSPCKKQLRKLSSAKTLRTKRPLLKEKTLTVSKSSSTPEICSAPY